MKHTCVRLHHPTLRSCTYRLWEPGHAHPGAQHGWAKPKMYPLLIDENGDTLVSTTVWYRLQAAGKLGRIEREFIYLNDVPDPPTLRIGGKPGAEMSTYERGLDDENRQISEAIKQIAPAVQSFHIQPSTKYRPSLAGETNG